MKGNVIRIFSKRDFSSSDLTHAISTLGKPLLVGVDKAKLPKAAEKLAARFSSKICTPENDLLVQEKSDMVASYLRNKDILLNNSHEKDALASALFAYDSVSDLFEKIDITLARLRFQSYSEDVKELIMKRKAMNISDAVDMLTKKPEPRKEEKKVEINEDFKEKSEELARKFKEKSRSYDVLKEYTEKLETKIEKLEKEKSARHKEESIKTEDARKNVIKTKEIRSRDILIRQLQFELAKHKLASRELDTQISKEAEFKDLEDDGQQPFMIIKDFTKDAIAEAGNIENMPIFFQSYSPSKRAAKLLTLRQPSIALFPEEPEELDILTDAEIKVISCLEPKVNYFYASVPMEEVKRAMNTKEKRNFLDIIRDYRKGSRNDFP